MARVRDPALIRILHLDPTKECVLCGVVERLELHHVLPRAQGGGDVHDNLVFLCHECHRRITVNDVVARRLLGEYLTDHRPDILTYIRDSFPSPEQGNSWLERRYFVGV